MSHHEQWLWTDSYADTVPGMDADLLRARLSEASTLTAQGRVSGVTGLAMRLKLPGARVGDIVHVKRRGDQLPAEVVGFQGAEVIALPLGELTGVGPDDTVESRGEPWLVPSGDSLLGRVLDGFGKPIDGRQLQKNELTWVATERAPPPALERQPVVEPMATGVRVIDSLLSLGVGQRVGLFAGSGVGKSTLLGAIAQGVAADVVVLALVGERGREVREFMDECLGDALTRSVLVVATSDAPALERLKAAQTATAIAEGFRDKGKRVMLLVDSITRFARAQREVGLAAGEPPARRGYPPSVFAALPRLLERTGQGKEGSITALYTVLVEGGDMEEPIADEVRGILDGHIVLNRQIASRGWYPAVDVGQSLSRVMGRCVSETHRNAASVVRQLLAAYESKRDLISLGAYSKGSDRAVDQAISAMPAIEQLLTQPSSDGTEWSETEQRLTELASRYS